MTSSTVFMSTLGCWCSLPTVSPSPASALPSSTWEWGCLLLLLFNAVWKFLQVAQTCLAYLLTPLSSSPEPVQCTTALRLLKTSLGYFPTLWDTGTPVENSVLSFPPTPPVKPDILSWSSGEIPYHLQPAGPSWIWAAKVLKKEILSLLSFLEALRTKQFLIYWKRGRQRNAMWRQGVTLQLFQ
jgi:hypothetical protein